MDKRTREAIGNIIKAMECLSVRIDSLKAYMLLKFKEEESDTSSTLSEQKENKE